MKRKSILIAALLSGAVGFGGYAIAQSAHTSTMNHTQAASGTMDHAAMMSASSSELPVSEPGQSAFAAIGEIVAKMEADPNTDWSKVNIAGLREHLRDMSMVTLNAKVLAEAVDGGTRFTVTGGADVSSSIKRMIVAHAGVAQGTNGWEYAGEAIENGAVMTVLVPDSDMAKLNGLGLFGLLAMGNHHQVHHWVMASGADPHL